MRETLRQRLTECPVCIPRQDIEAMGTEIGLSDPVEAVRVFDRLKGVSWRGEYVRDDEGWVAAWVKEVT